MAMTYNISDVVSVTSESPNGYSGLKPDVLLIVRERLGFINDEAGYVYVVSDGVRSYVIYASSLELIIDVTNTPSEGVA